VLRRLLIVTSCIVFLGSPLADVLCYANCPNSAAAAGEHSCSSEPDDSAALNGVSHGCLSTVDVAFPTVEIRPVLAAVATSSSILLDRPITIVRLGPANLSNPLDLSPQALTPLRL
jgi:hypothetical protein